jgi:hypothetical protein
MELPIQYWSEKVGKTVPRELELVFKITGAKAVSPAVQGLPVLTAFDAVASQAVIDSFLGTSSEFLVAAFDATAMGTDAFAGIVNLAGQAASLVSVSAKVASGTAGVTQANYEFVSSAALTASTLVAECALGASGNVAFKLVSTGLDALTSGMIVVKLKWISK